jgi:hypothetical protein
MLLKGAWISHKLDNPCTEEYNVLVYNSVLYCAFLSLSLSETDIYVRKWKALNPNVNKVCVECFNDLLAKERKKTANVW